jgi:riboflavin synthase
VETSGDAFTADVMRETLDRSSLGALTPGAPVNLERPMRLDGRLGGHLVQGHVDGTGVIEERTRSEHWDVVRISLPHDLARYVVHKGSITVDGVSLTVASVDEGSFTVSLIPTTLELTTLGRKQPGDPVNLEVDVVAKYVERLLTREKTEES